MATDNKNNFLFRWEQLKTFWEKLKDLIKTKADDSKVVHLTGEEEVTSKKSFTAGIETNNLSVKKEKGDNKKAIKLSMNSTTEGNSNYSELIISENPGDTSISRISSRGSNSSTILNSEKPENSNQLVTAKAVHDYLNEYYSNDILKLTADDIGKYLIPCNDVNVKDELRGGGGPYSAKGEYLLVLDKEYKAIVYEVPVITSDKNGGPFTSNYYTNYLSSNITPTDSYVRSDFSWPCLAKKVEVIKEDGDKIYKWVSIIVRAVIPCGIITGLNDSESNREINSLDDMIKDGITEFSNGYSFKSIGILFRRDNHYGNKYLMGHDSNIYPSSTRYRFQEWFHWNGYWYNPFGY